MDFRKIKKDARNSLKGKYFDVIKLYLIYFLIIFVSIYILSVINLNKDAFVFLSIIIELSFGGLFTFGYHSYFLKISRNEEVKFTEFFKKTNLFIACLSIAILVGIFTFLWTLVFIIPGIIASINYYFVFYVALDNPDLEDIEVLKKCKEIMYGHKFEFFILTLSFIGWIILGLFTFGLLYIWLIPYMNVTYANFYNEIKDEV